MSQLTEQIKQFLRQAGIENVELVTPPKPEMGDLALACFSLAKEQKKNPATVAKELSQALQATSHQLPVIERVAAFGPYVNFFLNSGEVAKLMIEEIIEKGDEYGSSQLGNGKSVLVEYPSNNTHKEFHIGHFRNTCIGNPMVRLHQKCGYEAHPVNYLNDFGAHVAKCLWAFIKFHRQAEPPENKQKWLGEIYVEASKYLLDHKEAGSEVGDILQKLEARNGEIWPLFMETRQWSIDKFEELFKELGVVHEYVFCEKDVKSGGHKIVAELLEKGVATVGERGAIIIDLKPFNLDIALVRKADGAGLYITSDLALAQEKFKKFKVDESIHIAGQEQVFYFKQLFKILELAGFKKKMTHLSYGLVTLPEGKMSSRTGKVILYEDLRDQVVDSMAEATRQRHPDWPEEKVQATARNLALAALKFDMQKHEAAKNIVFDIKEAISFEGFSGPYVLYVIARINSLERKAKDIGYTTQDTNYSLLSQPEEKKLAISLGEYGAVIKKALDNYNPSTVARYAFDLAQSFNDFYNKHSVLNSETMELAGARLALANAVKQVLTNALNVLTIPIVEEM